MAFVIGEPVLARLVDEVRAALRRRPAHEARLAGTLRALAGFSPELLNELLVALETVARRGSFERPLYGAAVRALGEHGEGRLCPLLSKILVSEEAGGLATLAACCFTRDASLGAALSKVAMSRHPLVAFGAEVARVSRNESQGERIFALAPKIKEAHRIALCSGLFFPLLARAPLPASVAPALAVLRDSERHLGRWLLLGELAARAGDPAPLAEARKRAESGPPSARPAWSLVAWALEPKAEMPAVRPTLELIARLSDRPSAERDVTFLFRMANARVPSALLLLEGLARGPRLRSDVSLRAALHLCRDYGHERYLDALAQVGAGPSQEGLRGLAVAALYDCGRQAEALRLAAELERSRHLPSVGWGSLVRITAAGGRAGAIVSEPNFRRLQQGTWE